MPSKPNRLTASVLFWEAAGCPRQHECVGGQVPFMCYVCGAVAVRGMKTNDRFGPTFVSQTMVACPSSEWTCEACIYATAWTRPPDVPDDGRKRGPNLRMFTHLYDAGEYRSATRQDRTAIQEFLAREKRGPWFAAIAESGKKHVLPFAPVNASGGRRGMVRFEERTLMVGDMKLVQDVERMLWLGFSRSAVQTLRYPARLLAKKVHIMEETLEFERRWGEQRGSGWFDLALWLARSPKELKEAGIEPPAIEGRKV